MLPWKWFSTKNEDSCQNADAKSASVKDELSVSNVSSQNDDAKPVLPRRPDDVMDWEPPPVRRVGPREQAEALVAFFQGQNIFGEIPCWDAWAFYPECAWLNGFVQFSERQLYIAMAQVCERVRRDYDVEGRTVRAVCYVIPKPYFADKTDTHQSSGQGNVVPIGTKRSKIPSGSRLSARSPEGKVARAKARARKGGTHRADIREAVACNL